MQSAWFQWLIVEVFYCLHVLTLTSYAIGADALQHHLQLNSVQMGSLAAAFFIAFGLSQLLIGSQLGTRSNRLIIGVSAALATIGALLLLGAHTFLTALIARILMGAGVGNALVSTVHVVSERFPSRFPLMTNLSQAAANFSGAMVGLSIPFIPALKSITFSFQLGFILLLIDTVFILLFVRDLKTPIKINRADTQYHRSVLHRFQVILLSPPFWTSLAFFAGLFGGFLSFAEVWNIQFQIEVFRQDSNFAPLINTAVIMGLAIGSLGSGAIADRIGHQIPARVGAVLTLSMLLLLMSGSLPIGVVLVAQALLGLGMGTATLGLTALRCSVSNEDFPLASALMLTGVFMSAGLLSAAVGMSAGELQLEASRFEHYQRAMVWFAGFASMACIASFSMRQTQKPAA